MKRKLSAIFKSIGLLVGFFMAQMIFPIGVGIYHGFKSGITGNSLEPAVIEAMVQTQLSLIIMQFVGLFFLFIVFKIKKTKVTEYIAFKKVEPNRIIMFLAYGFAFQFIAIIGNVIVSQFYNLEKSAEALNNVLNTGDVFLSLIFVLIVAPIVEEILFRGVILTKLNNHMSKKAAIIIQALMFSLYHFNFVQMLPTFLLGLFLGFCYLEFKNIWVPILIHFSFNVFASLVPYIPENMYMFIFIIPVIAGLIAVTLTQKYAVFNKS